MPFLSYRASEILDRPPATGELCDEHGIVLAVVQLCDVNRSDMEATVQQDGIMKYLYTPCDGKLVELSRPLSVTKGQVVCFTSG